MYQNYTIRRIAILDLHHILLVINYLQLWYSICIVDGIILKLLWP